MTAKPEPLHRDSAASWLPGGLLVLVEEGTPSAESAEARDCIYEHEDSVWRVSLACAHDATTRSTLEGMFGGHTCGWQALVRERFAPLHIVRSR